MARRAPPPDFRYVWLTPVPPSLGPLGAGAFAAGVGAAFWLSGHAIVPTLAAFACTAMIASAAGTARRPRSLARARQAEMAIVPWGVIVEPDREPRVLRWPGVRRVSVHVRHAMRGGTPVAIETVVAVDTGREVYTGCAAGAVGLEDLTVNLGAYAHEASRPIALDLDGTRELAQGVTEPVFGELLSKARELCATGRGAAQLGLPPGSYRSMATAAAGPETVATLRTILCAQSRGADARPLAAIVAGLLGARDLVPTLLRLVSAPHPVVAAVAKAAALRLGAAQSRAGAIREVAAFLFDEDKERLEAWAAGC